MGPTKAFSRRRLLGGTSAYTPLFQEDAEALAWDGTQFHGSNGNGYWTAPLNGPATLVLNADGVEEGFDPGAGAVQTITGLAFGNGTLFGSDCLLCRCPDFH